MRINNYFFCWKNVYRADISPSFNLIDTNFSRTSLSHYLRDIRHKDLYLNSGKVFHLYETRQYFALPNPVKLPDKTEAVSCPVVLLFPHH